MKTHYDEVVVRTEFAKRVQRVHGKREDFDPSEFDFDDASMNEIRELLPWKWAVCGRCDGEGTVLIDGLEGVAFTMEEFHEAFDPDEQYAYFNGGYDRTCPDCNGRTTIKAVDRNWAESLCPNLLAYYDSLVESYAETEAMYAAERRMGA